LLALAFVFILGLAASLLAQPRAVEEAAHRFCAVDIYLDSRGAPLAAYQIEFLVTNGVAKIVGIEGGEHPAFRNSPLYDSKAIQKERVIIAAFSLLSADALPVGKTRIATIHLMISGNVPPAFEAKLQTGADTNGNKISADVTFEKKETK